MQKRQEDCRLRKRTKVCPECDVSFSYEIGSGRDRKYCSAKCREDAKKGFLNWRRTVGYGQCVVDGCDNIATRKADMMCEKHFARMRRTGRTDRVISGRYKTGAGYVKILKRGHPIADSAGNVFEHRLVAFELNSGVCPVCFWCGKDLEWSSAVVDHLDENKQNNEHSNLVVACNDCNRARGAMLPFLDRMTAESYDFFVKNMTKWKTARGE